MELCSGSVVLSATAKRYGLGIFPVDCKPNRRKPFAKKFELDLTADFAWESLRKLRDTHRIIAWHFGLPCGTCSRARGIPLPNGNPGPQPLRSDVYLMGVP